MQTKYQITKTEAGFEVSINGCVVEVCATMKEAQEIKAEEEREDEEFNRENLVEMVADNPGYRGCSCEDYPCCGH